MAIVDLIVVLAVLWAIASALALVGLALLYMAQWRRERAGAGADGRAIASAVAGSMP